MISEVCENKLKLLFETLLTIFQTTENNVDFTEIILNLLLVCYGVRFAFLYEETNYGEKSTSIFLKIVDRINSIGCLKLKTTQDKHRFPRIFVYLDKESREKINPTIYPVDDIIEKNPNFVNIDNEIAKILDFYCIGHINYGSSKINRVSITVNIKNKSVEDKIYTIKTEVCEKDKFNIEEAKKKYLEFVKKINDVIEKYNYISYYRFENIFSDQHKLKMLESKDSEFILNNLNKYLSDLNNHYISDDVELEKSITYKKFIDINNTIKNDKEFIFLVDIYKKCIDKKFDSFYYGANSYDKLKKVSKKLSDDDINSWKNLKSDGKKKSKKKSRTQKKIKLKINF